MDADIPLGPGAGVRWWVAVFGKSMSYQPRGRLVEDAVRARAHVPDPTFRATRNVWSVPLPANPPVAIAAATPVTKGSQVIEEIAVSRDGKWVAYRSMNTGSAVFQHRPARSDVWVIEIPKR